jgi:protocatechuate 3,4-dioxygenase beta subunit
MLSRRDALKLLGVTGAAILAGCGPGLSGTVGTGAPTPIPSLANAGVLPACVVRPAMTEGPYFVDEKLNRSDIRSDPSDGSVREGLPLQLAFRVSQVSSNGCAPLAGAGVDVWHCDALGVYSDVNDPGFNTQGSKFLRGYQVTDADGLAQFITIYPGWYPGRTVHIHFKIRSEAGPGSVFDFTSQLFFDDALTDQVYAQPPYASRGQRTLRNEGDNIFRNGGEQLTLQLAEAAPGYATTFDIGLDMA